METLTIGIGLLTMALYCWLALPGMYRRKHYNDLAVNIILVAATALWWIILAMDSPILNPSRILGSLFAPLIRLVYGPWT